MISGSRFKVQGSRFKVQGSRFQCLIPKMWQGKTEGKKN
jgi:hypothetical protein